MPDSTAPADADVAIVGAGIAGAATAAFLVARAPGLRVRLLEREPHPGLHSTGRSAAMFMESYGPAAVRAATRASRAFFERPPPGFAAHPLLAPRGALYIAGTAQAAEALALAESLRTDGVAALVLDGTQARARVPVLCEAAAALAVLDPAACDLDVQALHQGWLVQARRGGATLHTDCELLQGRAEGAGWTLHTRGGVLRVRQVVNAAGAWADELAARCGVAGVGLQPRRRSAFVFEPPAGLATAGWPCVAAVDESFYIKPEAGLLLGSPANADPVAPHDVQPEELDIATGIARIEAATTLRIRRPRRTWAGLRSFVPDGNLVCGEEPAAPGFFWLAGQGGYGIQSSAAMGELAAALLLQASPPDWAGPWLASLAPRRGAAP
jgi:D-arginine dehydrogenase